MRGKSRLRPRTYRFSDGREITFVGKVQAWKKNAKLKKITFVGGPFDGQTRKLYDPSWELGYYDDMDNFSMGCRGMAFYRRSENNDSVYFYQ